MAKTLVEPAVQALLDREAIRDLPLRYCDCVWRNDVGGLVKLFARDGAFAMRADGKPVLAASGHADLRKFFRKGLSIQPRPYIHNHVLELTGPDSATGRCYLDLRGLQQEMGFIGAGFYEDDYVKVKGEWRFARRMFTAIQFDEVSLGKVAKAQSKDKA